MYQELSIGYILFFTTGYPIIPAPFIEKTVFLLMVSGHHSLQSGAYIYIYRFVFCFSVLIFQKIMCYTLLRSVIRKKIFKKCRLREKTEY